MSWMGDPFPPRLSFGVECDPEWETVVTATISGWESRNLNWTNARHNYDASLAIRTLTDHQEVRTHFHKARGKTHSWPLTDPSDHVVAMGEGVVVQNDDSDMSLQLTKRYGSGEFAYDRKITRPHSVLVYVSGVLQDAGSDYLLDEQTGALIVFDTEASADSVTWTGEFYVPCRYDTTKLPVRIMNKSGNEFLVSSDSIPILEVRE